MTSRQLRAETKIRRFARDDNEFSDDDENLHAPWKSYFFDMGY